MWLSSDRDGRFTLDNILAFADLARSRARVYAPYEFQAQMQGFCTLAMWRWVADAGPAAFANWCGAPTCRGKLTTPSDPYMASPAGRFTDQLQLSSGTLILKGSSAVEQVHDELVCGGSH